MWQGSSFWKPTKRLSSCLLAPKSFPGGSDCKESACNVENLGSIPGSGRSRGEGNGNPLQYSCLGNPMDEGAWWAKVHGVAKVRDVDKDQEELRNGNAVSVSSA